jgi:hypothetical protein
MGKRKSRDEELWEEACLWSGEYVRDENGDLIHFGEADRLQEAKRLRDQEEAWAIVWANMTDDERYDHEVRERTAELEIKAELAIATYGGGEF